MYESLSYKNLVNNMTESKRIKKREYEDYSLSTSNRYKKYARVAKDPETGDLAFNLYYHDRNFASVRSDNSIQWVGKQYDQGLNCVINEWCRDGIRTFNRYKSNGSSALYTRYLAEHYKVEIPLFEDSRYYMHNDEPVKPFDIHQKMWDRKKCNKVKPLYQDVIARIEEYIQKMSNEDFRKIVMEYNPNDDNYNFKELDIENYHTREDNIKDWIARSLHLYRNTTYYWMWNLTNRDNFKEFPLKDLILEDLYRKHDCFKTKVIGWEERRVPSCKSEVQFVERESK